VLLAREKAVVKAMQRKKSLRILGVSGHRCD